jgi:hypothetical protein
MGVRGVKRSEFFTLDLGGGREVLRRLVGVSGGGIVRRGRGAGVSEWGDRFGGVDWIF